eukprot:Sspe_Gene.57634::Locus_31613_Transcript_1_1_Confidence_1.000_Length_1708::g.57634::m.57634/K00059/fabG; 3-oxoacyl-[acyl-carrier protein] reductase
MCDRGLVVVGGSGRYGSAICEAMLRQGLVGKATIIARGEERLREAQARIEAATGKKVEAIAADVLADGGRALQSAMNEAAARMGRIDVLACALVDKHERGVQPVLRVEKEDALVVASEFESVLDVNLKGAVRSIFTALPHLLKAKQADPTRSPLVVAVGSRLCRYVGNLERGATCSAKHGVLAIVHSVFLECRSRGVKATTVNPSNPSVNPIDVANAVALTYTTGTTGCVHAVDLMPIKAPREVRDPSDFTKHVAVVTGGSRGIGRSIAVELARRGAQVVVLGRDQKALEEAVKECGPRGRGYTLDVTDVDGVKRMYEDVKGWYGHLTCVVSSAGTNRRRLSLDGKPGAWKVANPRVWHALMDTNVNSSMTVAAYGLPLLADAAQEGTVHPTIIFIASSAIRVPGGPVANSGGLSSYLSSKSAIENFAMAVAREVAPFGVKVSCINPGLVATELGTRPHPRLKVLKGEEMIQPWEVAHAAAFAVSATCAPTAIDMESLRDAWPRAPRL